MNIWLFSYGTLQKDEVQLELFERLLNGTSDLLSRYRAASVEIKDEAFLARGENSQQLTLIASDNENDLVQGMVFEISYDELLRADKYEPDGYIRVRVKLASGKQAWVYWLRDSDC